jgi:Polyketide cyclase / dehydrase and lipid transport
MSALPMQTIDWITAAPLRVEARAESTAAPDKVFAVLADHERWPEWFPRVKKVSVLGQAEGVGARRRVELTGMTVDEEFIVWDPGARWTFTAYDARPRFTRALVEDCMLTPLPSGGTAISYTMYMDPVGPVGFLIKRVVGMMRKNNTQAMQNLAARAAN